MPQRMKTIHLHSYINITLWKVDVTAGWCRLVGFYFCPSVPPFSSFLASCTEPDLHIIHILATCVPIQSVLHILPFGDSIRARDFIQCKLQSDNFANFCDIERAADSVWSLVDTLPKLAGGATRQWEGL